MITVWNTPIAASVEQILIDLRLMLFAEGLLKDQNNTGSDVMVTCPFHNRIYHLTDNSFYRVDSYYNSL